MPTATRRNAVRHPCKGGTERRNTVTGIVVALRGSRRPGGGGLRPVPSDDDLEWRGVHERHSRDESGHPDRGTDGATPQCGTGGERCLPTGGGCGAGGGGDERGDGDD